MAIAADPDIALALRQKDAALALIDRFYEQHRGAEGAALLWVVMPVLRAQYLLLSPVPISGRLPMPRVAIERLGNHAYSLYRPSNVSHTEAGPAMFCIDTFSDRWPIEPIIARAEAAGHRRRELTARARRRDLSRLNRHAARLAGQFAEAVVAAGLQAPCPPAWIYRQFLGAARYMAHARALLSDWPGEVVVVGTNHNKAGRALLNTAHEKGLASVYVPHCPMVEDSRVWDLPVSYAALRGQGERRIYGRLGVDPGALVVVGNPGLAVPSLQPLEQGGPVAFALPPVSARQMAEAVETVYEAAGERVMVTPHPSQSPDDVRRICPSSWSVWEGRSYDYLLSRRPPAFIQHSSGVAQESLLLGVPTVQLSVEGWSRNYLVIDRDHLPFAATSGELSEALGVARDTGADAERRARLVEWAREWCGFDGEQAARRGWALIERAREQPRNELAWDAWADLSAARAAVAALG